MSLHESTAEAAALTWLRELGHVVGHGPNFAPGEAANGTGLTCPSSISDANSETCSSRTGQKRQRFKDHPVGKMELVAA